MSIRISGALDAYGEPSLRKWLGLFSLDDQLQAACSEGLPWLARELVAAGANPANSACGSLPIIDAAAAGHAECVELLLPWASASQRNCLGQTALMAAAAAGHARCVEMLLPSSDPDAVDGGQRSAAMLATLGGHAECVKILADVSNLSARDPQGRTALMLACSGPGGADCARELLPRSDPFARADDGRNAIEIATDSLADECVRMLTPHYVENAFFLTYGSAACDARRYVELYARLRSIAFAAAEREAVGSAAALAAGSKLRLRI